MRTPEETEPLASPVLFQIEVTEEIGGCRAELRRLKPDRKLLSVVGDHPTQQSAFTALLKHALETGEGC